ncbi:MAG: hypothetical protein GXO39_08425 [Thermotogae bacterium]|nr:hypothetical protein [Thermotogota bacterium]
MRRLVLALIGLMLATPLLGIPTYARRFNKSCVECHITYPKLHYESEKFKYNNYLPQNYNPRMKTIPFRKDNRLYLPADAPISFRVRSFMGWLANSGNLNPHTALDAGVFLSFNLSSISAFYIALTAPGISMRDAFLTLKLPFSSRLLIGRYDLSEFFFKRSLRLTYADLIPYTRANLKGDGFALSLTPYFQVGMLSFDSAKAFLRAGANTKHFTFGVWGIPADNFQRYGLDLRVRFAFFDLFTTTVLALNQKLGEFQLEDSTAYITGYAGVDLTFGHFYTSFLYNYIGSLKKEYMPSDHLSLLSWAVGFYPVSNVKVALEMGYNFAASFPADGTYGGIVLDWSF